MGIRIVLFGIVLLGANLSRGSYYVRNPTVQFRQLGTLSFLDKTNIAILHRRKTQIPLSLEAVASSDQRILTCVLADADTGESLTPPFESNGFWMGMPSSNDPYLQCYFHWYLSTPEVMLSHGQHHLSIIVREGQNSQTNTAAIEILSLEEALLELTSAVSASLTDRSATRTLRFLNAASSALAQGRFTSFAARLRAVERHIQHAKPSSPYRDYLNRAVERLREAAQ